MFAGGHFYLAEDPAFLPVLDTVLLEAIAAMPKSILFEGFEPRFTSGKCVHELVDGQALRTPAGIATCSTCALVRRAAASALTNPAVHSCSPSSAQAIFVSAGSFAAICASSAANRWCNNWGIILWCPPQLPSLRTVVPGHPPVTDVQRRDGRVAGAQPHGQLPRLLPRRTSLLRPIAHQGQLPGGTTRQPRQSPCQQSPSHGTGPSMSSGLQHFRAPGT